MTTSVAVQQDGQEETVKFKFVCDCLLRHL